MTHDQGSERAESAARSMLVGHTDDVNSVAISPDGAWLASGSGDGTVRLWNSASGGALATLVGPPNDPRRDALGLYRGDMVNAVAIALDGAWLATASEDGAVRLWDASTGSIRLTLVDDPLADGAELSPGLPASNALAISPDGSWVASATEDGAIRYGIRTPDGCGRCAGARTTRSTAS